jgi:hypothetical protein
MANSAFEDKRLTVVQDYVLLVSPDDVTNREQIWQINRKIKPS